MHHTDSTAAGLMAGLAGAYIFVFVLIVGFAILTIWMYWRIFEKAGFSGALSLLNLIPGPGNLICLIILAFSQWPTHQVGTFIPQVNLPTPPPIGGPPQPIA